MHGECFLCGDYGQMDSHHIFGGANRKLSEKYGLKVLLCPHKCHNFGKESVHMNARLMQELHEYGQRKFMKENDATIEEFRKLFGKNYL